MRVAVVAQAGAPHEVGGREPRRESASPGGKLIIDREAR